ncbi:MAG: sodium:calcium antiporter [Thermomicrobiales bacterium]
MFSGMALPYLLAIFLAAAIVVWRAGTSLSDQTDLLSRRFGLGEALGGVIMLAIATNLPEIAIMVSAVIGNNIGVAIGNILGGIAIQTVVLVILDICTPDHRTSLTNEGASLMLAVEGMLVVLILALVVMATQLPDSAIFARVAPGTLGIAMTWVAGVWLIGKARKDLPWQLKDAPEHSHKGSDKGDSSQKNGTSTLRSALIFAIAAIATLTGGVLLERTGDVIATHIGMT